MTPTAPDVPGGSEPSPAPDGSAGASRHAADLGVRLTPGAIWLGPGLALGLALPAWMLLAVQPAAMWSPPRAFLVAAYTVYAALVWIAVLTDSARRFWFGPLRTTAHRWLAVGGFTAAPAVVGCLPSALLAFAAVALVATVVGVSPRLSRDAADLVERSVSRRSEVRPIAAVPTGAGMASVWRAVEASSKRGDRLRVPPRWHPCQGASGNVRYVAAVRPDRTGAVRLYLGPNPTA